MGGAVRYRLWLRQRCAQSEQGSPGCPPAMALGKKIIALVCLGLGVVSVVADPGPKPRPRPRPGPQDPAYDDGYNYNYDAGDYGDYGDDTNAYDYGTDTGYGEPDPYDEMNSSPAVPDAPSAVEVDYNFDEVTDKCDKEVCPPQETIQPSYEERRGSTQGSGRPGSPGSEGRP